MPMQIYKKQIDGHGLHGEFKNEQEFKRAWIKSMLERSMPGTKYFCIESEETEPGFPDVMKLTYDNHAFFYEMKITDKDGYFDMQPTQPIFYKQHPEMLVNIIVWSRLDGKAYSIKAEDIISSVKHKLCMHLNVEDFKDE